MIGRTFGEFVVRELLSSGGFGTVYRAEQPALAREAVIKVLHPRHRSETGAQRFLREAQLASRLDHPYAAHTYAFGVEPDGILWIAMELVRGTPLDRLLETQGPISLERFVPLLDRICEVIHTAHEHGIVHRDLKPANVMVMARAGRLIPKLLDLGIAKVDDAAPDPGETPPSADADPRLTGAGAMMGSPRYMAPEQWTSVGAVDGRTDQYALGVLCYEALTGRLPFTGETLMAIARAHARQPVPSLGDGFPPALDGVLARAMAKRPAGRFANVMELSAAFRDASGASTEAVTLPRLPDRLRLDVLATAPQPLAQAVASLDAARNPHQARDALWQVLRVAVRLVGVAAIASHTHVALAASASSEALLRLRRRSLSDAEWLEIALALCRPFENIRDAHPIPELVALVLDHPPDALLALRASADESPRSSDEQVRELLATGIALTATLLERLAFLADYPLIVTGDPDAELWMGVARSQRPKRTIRGKRLPAGQPALVDGDGVPVLALWPYVQCLPPAPGAPACLFFFEGKGRRGARMVALPDAFEREDDALWGAFGDSFRDTPDGVGAPVVEEKCPFPGLAAFTSADAASFFGRERETEAFLNRLRVQPLLAVVGPSGAGKSSFVQAGVIPQLPDGWRAITIRPGATPMATLAARLPDTEGGGPVVLVVDQLEELFTLCDDAGERARFAETLVGLGEPVRIVLTLRDDFLLHAGALPALRSRLDQGIQLLTTPAAADLRRILVEPVTRGGYEFDDPALPDEMVDAIAGTPGALALLSFTAGKLWELRDRRFRQLGRSAYTSLGGIGGALAQHAEATLLAMPAEQQRLVREVFRHAVTAEGTRAVLSRAELDQVLGGGTHPAAVVEKLVAARLLVISENDHVEITHEALLDAWPRLVGWRRDDAEGAQLRDALRAAARQWEERDRGKDLLWRGDVLAEYRRWRARHAGALTEREREFAAASLDEATRRRRVRVGSIAAAFVILVGGVVALLFLAARADRQRARAEGNERTLQANLMQQYEDQGRRLVLDGDPLQGLAYLSKAASLGAAGRAHDFLVAAAVRATDGELLEVRHRTPVTTARFSRDGGRLLTASYDHTARIWDARTGALVLTLTHAGVVLDAELGPDGETVLTGSGDGTAVLWNARTGARLFTFDHGAPVPCVLYSPDGSAVLTAGEDDTVTLRDVATGRARVTVRGDAAGQRACAFSPDGRRIAAGDRRGTTRIWDAGSGDLVASLEGQTDAIQSVRFSPDGARVVTASREGTADEWDVASGQRLHRLAHRASVTSAVFSPDGARIASSSNDHTAVVWDAATGAKLATLTGHAAGVNRVLYTPDGKRLVTVSDDAAVRLWDAATGRPLARWLGHADIVEDVALDANGGRIASAGDDGSAIVWALAPQEPVTWLLGHTSVVEHASFAPDGNHVVTASRDGTARIWDVATGRELLVLRDHDGAIHWAVYSPDGLIVATAGDDTTVRLWDAHTGAPRRVLTGHTKGVNTVSWSPDGTRVISAAADGTFRVWSAASGATLLAIRGHGGFGVHWASFDPRGAAIATAGGDNVTRLWDASSGEAITAHPAPEAPIAVALDPSGTWAASPVGRQIVKVWSAATGIPRTQLVGHVGHTMSVGWSPDGEMLITGAMDGTARIWDFASGDTLAIVPQGRQVWSASFSPDGTRILTTSDDGTVSVRELPHRVWAAGELERLLRCRVPFLATGDEIVPVERERSACALTGSAP